MMTFEQFNVRLSSDVRALVPRGNMSAWVSAAIRRHYEAEVADGLRIPVPDYVTKERPAARPTVVDVPTPPQRNGWWVPTSEEMETGVYTVLPETFAVNDEGMYHFVQVVPGPSYPYGDSWQGVRVKWKPAETEGPFTPSPGVLSAAIASDAARVAALIARHPR